MDYLSVGVAIVAVVFGTYYYLLREWNTFARHGVPYTKAVPILGNTWPAILWRKSFAQINGEVYSAHPDAKYVGFHDMTLPVVVLKDPELLKTVVVKNFDHFPEHRTFADETVDPLFGKNLFSLRGDRWKEVRNLTTPIFTSSKMKSMFKLMVACGEDFFSYVVQMPECPKGIDLKNLFTRYTNDVIATCAFGIDINSMKDPDNLFYVYGREATNFTGLRSLIFFLTRSLPWVSRALRLNLFDPKITKFFMDVVEDTMKARKERGIVRPDAIQQMMENSDKLSIEDMTAQLFIFFFGGFDSTATTMCFAAMEIAQNPDVHERLQREVDQVLEDNDGTLTYEAVNNMQLLDAVVNETLRMYPIAVFSDRRCTQRYELPPALPGAKPYVVEPGSYIWIAIYGMQRDPKYFPEPNKFNPDRFIDDPKLANCGVYLPFGLGPRMCIGNRFALLEVKVMLFYLMAYFDLKSCAKTKPLRISRKTLNMTAEDGFWLSLQPRSAIHPKLVELKKKHAKSEAHL